MIESEIAVLGAGPAGTTAALFLSNYGVPCVLVDKSEFPRDKVCGDCLGGYVISVLRQIGGDVFDRFVAFSKKTEGYGVHFFGPNLVQLSIPATTLVDGKIREVSLCRRKDFDNFLFHEAQSRKEIDIYNGIGLYSYKRENNSLVFYDRDENPVLKTKLAIVATGSQSKIASQLSGFRNPKKNIAGGLRCYYENVKPAGAEGYIEFHFLKEILPGYLWIFPLTGNTVNVGIGQRSDVIAAKKTDLKRMLPALIENYGHLRDRFQDARLLSPPAGFPLALGSAKRRISGNNFLLTGDAASLIEPFFGEGIGNAMYSGKFAAEQAVRSLRNNDFSASFNREYDRSVYNKTGNALRLSTLLQQAAFYPALVNRVFRNLERKPGLRNMLEKVVNGDMARDPATGIRFLLRSVSGI